MKKDSNEEFEDLFQPESHQIEDRAIQEAFATERRRMETAGHNWKQMGTSIGCTSCPLGHGFSVPPGVFLMGTDDKGRPILEKKFDI